MWIDRNGNDISLANTNYVRMYRKNKTSDTATSHATAQVDGRAQFLRTRLPTFLILLALAAIGYWGYRTEWRIPGFSATGEKETDGLAEPADTAGLRVLAPESVNDDCPLDQTRLQFPSAEAVRRAGIRVAPTEEKPLTEALSAPAEVDYDPTRVARLASPVPGRVWRVETEVGQRVRKGDVLALVDAVDVGKTKADFLEALTQLDLKAKTAARLREAAGAVAGRQVLEAEAALRDARIRLFNAEQALVNLGLPIKGQEVEQLPEEELAARVRFLGLPPEIVKSLDSEMATSNLLPLKAPFDGIVAERQVAPGEIVDASKILFIVADLSRVWIVMSVRQEDVDKLRLGQAVAFQPDGHPGEGLVQGEVSWISTTVDERTRTMRARAVVSNPGEHLRARTFGAARITIRDAPKAAVVPSEAVQQEGNCRFVFVRDAAQVFQVRQVQAGIVSGRFTEIQTGLRPGEFVATTGSFFLKSELLKGRLGEAD